MSRGASPPLLVAGVMLLRLLLATAFASATPVAGLAPEQLEPVTFANHTGRQIVHLFASPRGARYWGADTLAGRQALATGAEVDFYLHLQGASSYDILAVDHLGDAYLLWNHHIATGTSVRVEIGTAHLESGYDHPPHATVRVVNRSGRDVWYLFLAARGSSLAGADLLGADAILEDGETLSIVVPVTGETVGYELIGLDAAEGRHSLTVEITPSTRSGTVEIGASAFR